MLRIMSSFALIRHPMYSAALLVILSAAVAHPAWWALSLGALAVGFAAARITVEERLLCARFKEYGDYMRVTKVIPYVV